MTSIIAAGSLIVLAAVMLQRRRGARTPETEPEETS
jgi:hypothetical protein